MISCQRVEYTLSSTAYVALRLYLFFAILYAGLRVPGDQRQVAPSLPMHLVDVLATNDSPQTFSDSSGV